MGFEPKGKNKGYVCRIPKVLLKCNSRELKPGDEGFRIYWTSFNNDSLNESTDIEQKIRIWPHSDSVRVGHGRKTKKTIVFDVLDMKTDNSIMLF